MIDYFKKRIQNKSVLILGFGREGQSTLRLLKEADTAKKIAIADLKELTKDSEVFLKEEFAGMDLSKLAFHCGADYQESIDAYDIVMKSPGIVLNKEFTEYQAEILSQMQLVFEYYRDRIIGITGTKGKSTTTTLLYHILEQAQIPAVLAGNIGIPVFDILPQLTDDSLLVLELSCHQLEYMSVSPKKGILLNIYEEHLDHYGTIEKYVASKEKIYVNQKPGDILYVHPSVMPREGTHEGSCVMVKAVGGTGAASKKQAEQDKAASKQQKCLGRVILKGTEIFYGDRHFVIPTGEISLLGSHNYLDIAFVYGVCCDLGVRDEQFRDGLSSYVPLPHRLQYVGTIAGVSYYDDSISTIDETTIQALNTIQNTDTVLIGGMERDISYVNLEKYLATSTVSHIILMEATGKRIYREIINNMPDFPQKERLHVVEHLEDAVALAKKVTAKGRSCVLSPAAASYGIFQNFEKRGERFVKLLEKD